MKKQLFTLKELLNYNDVRTNTRKGVLFKLLLIIFIALGLTTEVLGSTLYLTTTSGGTQINIHKWGGDDATSWPGSVIVGTAVKFDAGSGGFYSNVLTSTNYLLHNNAGSQTGNLSISEDTWGQYNGTNTFTELMKTSTMSVAGKVQFASGGYTTGWGSPQSTSLSSGIFSFTAPYTSGNGFDIYIGSTKFLYVATSSITGYSAGYSNTTVTVSFNPATGALTMAAAAVPIITGVTSSLPTSSTTQTYKGATITVTGTTLGSVTTVKLGGSGGTTITGASIGATSITFVVPDGTSGGTVYVSDGTNNYASSATFTNLGYITNAATDWNTVSTWLGGAVPAASSNVTVAHAITLNAAATNTTFNNVTIATSGITFGASGAITVAGTLTNAGSIVMTSGGTLTMASGSTIANGTATFTAGTGTVAFAGSGTISGTIGFNNVTLAGGVIFGSASTINGTLTLNASGFVNTTAPSYASGSILKYNSGTAYGRGTEWSATTGAGYPYHVQISNSTTVDMGANSGAAVARQCAGNLTVDALSVFSMNTTAMTAAVTVMGNVVNNGTVTLSGSSGGDLKTQGNINDSGTFNANSRAIFFNGGNTQVIQGTGVFDISYVRINKTGGSVQLGTDLTCAGPNGGNAMEIDGASSLLDLNGFTLYLGASGVASTYNNGIATPGFIKGSSTSSISVLGTGALGTINFYAGSQSLNNLTINRTSTGTLTIGTDLTVSGTLTSTAGTLSMGALKTLTLSGVSSTPQTQCASGTFSPALSVNSTGASYQWYSNGSSSNTGGTLLVGANSNSYTPLTATGTKYYYCAVSGLATTVSNVSGLYTVNAATAIGSQSTATQTQYIGGSFSPITVTASGTGTLLYQWYSNASNSNSGGVSLDAANGAQTSSYTPQIGSAGTVYYYCIATSDCSTATSAVSGAFITLNTVTVSTNTNSSALPVCATCDINVTGGTLTLDANLDVSNALTLTAGVMDLNGKILTLGSGSTVSATSGTIKGGGTSSISVTGTGALGTLNFDQTTPGTTNVIKDLTINRTSAGTATIGNDLVISKTLQVTAGTVTSSGGTKLTLLEGSKATTESGSSLSVVDMVFSKGTTTTSQFENNGTVAVTGKIRVKVHFPDDQHWQFVSFPFTINSITKVSTGFAPTINTEYGQLWYDGAKRATGQSGWTTTSEMPVAGKGYAFWSAGDLYFETLNGDGISAFGTTATQALTYPSGTSANNNGWNFFAHPLTANANGKLAETGEFRYGYNYLTDTYNTSTSITSSEQQSFDAYFVKTASARTMNFSTVSMPASVRSSETSTTSAIDKVTLNLVGTTANYTTMVRMLPQSTTAYDELYDAPYSGGMFATTPQIYSLIGGLKCAINSVPEQTTVPIGIRVPVAGTYSFTWDTQLTNLPVTLYDNVQKTSTELSAASTYGFSTTVSGEINNRFSIIVAQKITTRLDNGSAENPLYVTNQMGGVRLDGLTGSSTVKLYDMVGKLMQTKVVSTSTMTLNVPVAGMYLLEVNNKIMKMMVK